MICCHNQGRHYVPANYVERCRGTFSGIGENTYAKRAENSLETEALRSICIDLKDLNDAVPHCIACEVSNGMQIQFPHKVCSVGFRSFHA